VWNAEWRRPVTADEGICSLLAIEKAEVFTRHNVTMFQFQNQEFLKLLLLLLPKLQ
jgi:hypothetical protein